MLNGRVRRGELTPDRLAAACARRVRAVPHRLAWRAPTGRGLVNRRRLAAYQGRHTGRRCFILGNGPSLAKMDLTPLRDEITFGLNRIYLLFDELPFVPSYFCAMNELVIEQFADDIRGLPMPKFLNWTMRDVFPADDENTLFLRDNLTLRDTFSRDPRQGICGGGTVTYAALQLAWFMGFQKVILIGVDHSFVETGTPNTEEVRTAERDESHCHPDYFPKGVRWQLPDLHRSAKAYMLARMAFGGDARKVVDATEGGKLEAFSKVDFATLFEN